ncbi:unnamed protein product [Polarella glacialis]|uniref:Uncharacterized protein n=1 Tax=Polarella glacialis TaxID=89957 RepID=A0A813GMJ9_POLGL|nr:unnamed protein product [Polarella glacialis]
MLADALPEFVGCYSRSASSLQLAAWAAWEHDVASVHDAQPQGHCVGNTVGTAALPNKRASPEVPTPEPHLSPPLPLSEDAQEDLEQKVPPPSMQETKGALKAEAWHTARPTMLSHLWHHMSMMGKPEQSNPCWFRAVLILDTLLFKGVDAAELAFENTPSDAWSTSKAIANMVLKVDDATERRTTLHLEEKMRERALLQALGWHGLDLPTLLSWMDLFQTRLSTLGGSDGQACNYAGQLCSAAVRLAAQVVCKSYMQANFLQPQRLAGALLLTSFEQVGLVTTSALTSLLQAKAQECRQPQDSGHSVLQPVPQLSFAAGPGPGVASHREAQPTAVVENLSTTSVNTLDNGSSERSLVEKVSWVVGMDTHQLCLDWCAVRWAIRNN